jgi:hypothetical protein
MKKVQMCEFMSWGQIRQARKIKKWSAEILASAYNEYMEDISEKDSLTTRSILRWEKENKKIEPVSRRQVLQSLFGLAISPVPFLVEKPTFDFQMMSQQLSDFWKNGLRIPHSINLAKSGVLQLEHTINFGPALQRNATRQLLCEYMIATGNLIRDHGEPKEALPFLQDAYILAVECEKPQLVAKAAYLEGFCWLEVCEFVPYAQKQIILNKADRAFLRAQQHINFLPSNLKTAIYSEHSVAKAYLAQIKSDQSQALQIIDSAYLQSLHLEDDPLFFNINKEWSGIDRIEVYLAIKRPNKALECIDDIVDLSSINIRQKKRYVYLTILSAESYAETNQHEQAASYLRYVLDSGPVSSTHIARINDIYMRLARHPTFHNTIDFALLSAHIAKANGL